MISEVLRIGPNITVAPIIHGSGDCALAVRRLMLSESFDCLAVPLPASFQEDVEHAIGQLPSPSIVTQPGRNIFSTEWSPEKDRREELEDDEPDDDDQETHSYVPIDPCQGVIAALRIAIGEHLPRYFIDLETSRFEPHSASLPDPYALKKVTLERFAAAILPTIERPPAGQPEDRILHMAKNLRRLARKHQSVLFVCSVLDWPWIREAVLEQTPSDAEDDFVEETNAYAVDPETLLFLFGELPYITGLYERARAELEDDENLSIDGVKELLLASRQAYLDDFQKRARKVTPHLLSQCLKYARNLSLLESRMTPDLYTLVVATQQTLGDQFAIHTAETARTYPYAPTDEYESIKLGIDAARLPDGDTVKLISRLPGPPLQWRSYHLKRKPKREELQQWQMKWNPFSQCSWPPEDETIEKFRSHVFDRARAVMGADLARTEKFTTSVQDGIDIRDTLRHWHQGDIYVKVLPPSRGRLDCAVMLFDSPADPREYPWRTTWFAEHSEESTLAFYATNFLQEMVGPGIGAATYGGCLFLFPPRSIPDVWTDERLDFADTLEERLLAAACLYSQSPHIALLSPAPPGPGWRRLAQRFHKKWVHLPLGQFSDATVQQLRICHVLNGQEIRSYASQFIRKA